ncbi:threonine/serine dehydratase [Bacillus sp. Cr_A10]|nr:threonine/serine dehydratase [Bacillus sp. Cr_A10]MDF2065792.1 threonine/serine dehydratase [Bacillus sp. Cr_A10]
MSKLGDGFVGNSYDTVGLYRATEKVAEFVHRTPCKKSTTLNEISGRKVFLKMENLQKTGSFKIRGAMNKVSQLTEAECAKGLIAASAGNHAQGVAYAGKARNVPVTIYMPIGTPVAKVDATKGYGATVKLVGQNFDEAYVAAREEQLRTGATFIHPFDDLAVIEGQATVAMEMLQQRPELDTIVVPAGGGGLLAGTLLAVKSSRPDIRVIGVQSINSAAIAVAYKGKNAALLPYQGKTIAEGINVKVPGKLTMNIIHSLVDDIITVTEQEIASAILFMLEREKTLIEGAGAAAVAAVLSHHIPSSAGNVGVIVSGGNFDIDKLTECQQMSIQVPMAK